MRCFFGLPLPEVARRALVEATAPLRDELGGRESRWVPAENLHLTLRFLGECDRRRLDAVTRCVDAVFQDVGAPRLQLGSPGVFPGRGQRPLVFWAGIEGDLRPLEGLAARLEECAREAGFKPERRSFRAHVTLARLKGAAARALRDRLLPPFPPLDCSPAGLHLFQSVSTPSGVEYPTLDAWAFCPPASSPKLPE